MMTERIHWESQHHNGTNGEVARAVATMISREVIHMHAEVEAVQRLRRFACVTLGLPERHTDTDVRLELISRLLGEVSFDMQAWLDAQIVALHDANQTLEVRNRRERERETER